MSGKRKNKKTKRGARNVTRARVLMLERGVRPGDIAEECGCSYSLVYQTVAGLKRNAGVEAAVARAVGVGVSELFGERTLGAA